MLLIILLKTLICILHVMAVIFVVKPDQQRKCIKWNYIVYVVYNSSSCPFIDVSWGFFFKCPLSKLNCQAMRIEEAKIVYFLTLICWATGKS